MWGNALIVHEFLPFGDPKENGISAAVALLDQIISRREKGGLLLDAFFELFFDVFLH